MHLNVYLMWSFDPQCLINPAYKKKGIASEKTHMKKIRAYELTSLLLILRVYVATLSEAQYLTYTW